MSFKLKSLNLLITFVFAIYLVSCQQDTNEFEKTTNIDSLKNRIVDVDNDYTAQEEKIIDAVYSIPEVKERGNFIEKETKGERHLKIWIASKPNPADESYWVKAGEDNGESLISHFDFFVYPDSMRIMFFDVASDEVITLEEWRKNK